LYLSLFGFSAVLENGNVAASVELKNGKCNEKHPLAEDNGTTVGSPGGGGVALPTTTITMTDAS